MDNAYQHSTIAQILENILEQFTFEGESRSNIADILLSILNKTEYNEDPHSVIGDLLIRLKAKIEGESYDPYDAAYTSRIAEILISILEETEYTKEPQSRIAELLLQLKEELEAYTELTASGSVASFITNVVKPLVNGEFSIVAYQEGTGDPAPDNVRNIIPFNTQKITKAGKNLFDKTKVTHGKWIDNATGEIIDAAARYCVTDYIRVNQGDKIVIPNKGNSRNGYFNIGKNPLGYFSATNTVYTVLRDGYIVFTIDTNTTDINNLQFEIGSQATDYEQYKGETATIVLGEDVYGGSYNSVTGVMRVEWIKKVINETSGVSFASNGILYRDNFFDIPEDTMSVKCNCYTRGTNRSNVAQTMELNPNYSFCCKTGGTPNRLMIKDTRFNTLEEFNEWVALNPISVLIMLAEPFEIQLDPTPINTFNGDNNIFCDTGDTSVTYLYKGTPPETVTRVLSKSPDVEDIIKEEKLEDLKDLDELQDLDISDKEVK